MEKSGKPLRRIETMKNCMLIFALFFMRYTSAQQPLSVDTLPESEISIPIQIDLKPIYASVEKNVSTVFTSPNYPNEWVQSDCTTRYKYHFRRSPLKMSMNGTRLNLAFMGYYKIIGSSRACINGTIFSPWALLAVADLMEQNEK